MLRIYTFLSSFSNSGQTITSNQLKFAKINSGMSLVTFMCRVLLMHSLMTIDRMVTILQSVLLTCIVGLILSFKNERTIRIFNIRKSFNLIVVYYLQERVVLEWIGEILRYLANFGVFLLKMLELGRGGEGRQ